MSYLKRSNLRFVLIVVLPALLIFVGTGGTLLVSLQEMAESVNRTEVTLTRRSVQAAVAATLRRMEATHRDYARWDEAARKVYGDPDQAFVAENYAGSTGDPIFFDTAYLIGENGEDVFGYRLGDEAAKSSAEAFSPVLGRLVAELRAAGPDYAVRSGLVQGAWGPAVMAVGPVLPVSDTFAPAIVRPRFLVLGKAFDQGMVGMLATDYLIDGLALAAPSAAGAPLLDSDGKMIAALVWSARQPGSEAHADIGPRAMAVLALLLATMVLLIAFAARGVARVQKGEAQARHAAMHDSLSGLPNRSALAHALARGIADLPGGGNDLAIVYLDLDGFKEVNDTYGHEVGDQLLRKVAAGFALLTGDRLLVRVGGDEFAVVIEEFGAADRALELGDQLVRFFNRAFDIDGRIISVGTSVGIALVDNGGITVDEALRRADVAMYQAKQQGRNRVCVYDTSLDALRLKRMAVAAELRRALHADALALAYQPIYDARTGQVSGVEALLRWPRGDDKPIPPGEFIPIAEETGMIDELGAWTLRRACRDARAWPGLNVSVNVSPAQFQNPDFAASVSAILGEFGFPARRLGIEVTETYFVAHPDQARRAIDAVRALGAEVALDDFGTGYSSIGYLRTFAFDKLKLDRSMIAHIDRDTRAQKLVQATIALAEALDLTVTAEGVETEEEATLLRIAGCDELQGFFFGRPVPASEITALLGADDRLGAPLAHIA